MEKSNVETIEAVIEDEKLKFIINGGIDDKLGERTMSIGIPQIIPTTEMVDMTLKEIIKEVAEQMKLEAGDITLHGMSISWYAKKTEEVTKSTISKDES